MPCLKLVLWCMFAALGFGALGASLASAICSGGTHSVFCFSNNQEILSEEGLGTVELSLFSVNIAGVASTLHCKDGKGRGLFETLGASKGEVEFLGCSVTTPANCVISEPIIAKFTGQLSTNTMPATDLLTGAGPGEEFAAMEIVGGSCVIRGKFIVSGLQTVEFPSGEISLSKHEIVAKKAKSKLKLGTEAGTFSATATVHLSSSVAYLIMLGL